MDKYLKNKKYTEDEIHIILTAIASYDSLFEINIAYHHIQAQVDALFLAAHQSHKVLVPKLLTNYNGSKIETNKVLLKKAIVMITRSALL